METYSHSTIWRPGFRARCSTIALVSLEPYVSKLGEAVEDGKTSLSGSGGSDFTGIYACVCVCVCVCILICYPAAA